MATQENTYGIKAHKINVITLHSEHLSFIFLIIHRCRLEEKFTENRNLFVSTAQLTVFFLSLAVPTLSPLLRRN